MECRLPPPVTEDEISAALDETADPAVYEHLANCESCTLRLEQARQVERMMKFPSQRSDCPAPHLLRDYHFGLLDQAEARILAGHLEQCGACRDELEELRTFLLADSQPQPEPQPARGARPRLGELFARVLAGGPALAIRGGAAGAIVATVEDTTIVLDVQPAGTGQVYLSGQLAASDQDRWTQALVELRQGGALRATAVLDSLGGFSCGPLAAVPTELRVTSESGLAVVLPQFDLIR